MEIVSRDFVGDAKEYLERTKAMSERETAAPETERAREALLEQAGEVELILWSILRHRVGRHGAILKRAHDIIAALRAALGATAAQPEMVLVGYVHPAEIAAALFESGESGWGSLPISPDPWGVMTMPLYRPAVPVAPSEENEK